MTRKEDLNLYEFDGRKIKFVGEADLDLPEWEAVRTANFAKLRNRGIPDELIDLVEQFKEQKNVRLYLFRPNKSDDTLQFGVQVVTNGKKKTRSERLREFVELRKLSSRPENKAFTAADALALFLRIHLRNLKYHEQMRSEAPVRKSELLPRSVIGEIALDLLDSCRTWNCAPGRQLTTLFREILDLDVDRGLSLYDDAKKWMAFAIAREPTVATRALARAIGVQPSTVLRWRRSSDFKEVVKLNAQKIASMRASAIAADKKLLEDALSMQESLLAKMAGIVADA